ncbi:MAG: cation-translocating P-type ATPase [bacterium]|nr:cation-translocating P-type ATPase [bacterium]
MNTCPGCSGARNAHHVTVLAALLLAAGLITPWLGFGVVSAEVWYALSMLVAGSRVFPRGLAAAWRRRLDINTLVTSATVGAVAIGQWQEGAVVVLLFCLGETLEAASLERTRRSLRGLLDLAPRQATAWRQGCFGPVPVDQVEVGDRILVRPGERVPVDGQVVTGHSWLDASPITGEPLPLAAGPGTQVHAGTLNQDGALEVVATSAARETTLARIIHLVERAQSEKAPVQRLVDRFAAWYTPLVLGLAAAAALLPPLLLGAPVGPWLYRALAFLLLACPCALVIATPVAVVTAIGQAARHGVLIKGGRSLEALGSLRAVVLDKTGTITEGRPVVADVIPAPGWNRRQVLELAAAVEAGSEHPLGAAIRRAAVDEGITTPVAADFLTLPGRGIRASVGGRDVWVGRPRPAAGAGSWPEAAGGLTAVVVEADGRPAGRVTFRDRVRAEAREAVAALRGQGIRRVEVLSGDAPAATAEAAAAAGADTFQGGLLPEDKAGRVSELAALSGGVAMVGDGINDAPALAAATVGIAMGGGGTDVALETAGVALIRPDLGRVAYAVELGRRARRVIAENVVLAVGIKLALLLLAIPGRLTLWLAVLGDSGTALLVIMNSLRLRQEAVSPVRKSAAGLDRSGCCSHGREAGRAAGLT